MAAYTVQEAKRAIDGIDMKPLIAKARKKQGMFWDAEKAARDYKQFLILVWFNAQANNDQMIVPTERADVLWHEHILFTREYHAFCDELLGQYLHHSPGLEKGSAPFNKAVEHTQRVQRDNRSDANYSSGYLGGCGGYVSTSPSGHKSSGDAGHGHDGGSSGSSCGGASCGGGGGGCGGGG